MRARWWASVACVGVIAATTAPGATPRAEASAAVKGTLTLGLGNVQKLCKAARAGTAALPKVRISCGAVGVFKGLPATAGANYYWTWVLPIGADGKTKANGPETGRIGLNFGGGAIVYLTTKGLEKPRGTTAARTTGTWVVQKGEGSYKGATGKGTYVFDTRIVGPAFKLMRITLTGAIN